MTYGRRSWKIQRLRSQIFHASMQYLSFDEYLELMMTAYLPAVIWILSGFVCVYIARRRNVKPTTPWKMLVAVIGPLAIPLVLVAKPEKLNQA